MDFKLVEETLNGIEERAQEELYKKVRDGDDLNAITYVIHQLPALREEHNAVVNKYATEMWKIYKKASDLDERLEY